MRIEKYDGKRKTGSYRFIAETPDEVAILEELRANAFWTDGLFKYEGYSGGDGGEVRAVSISHNISLEDMSRIFSGEKGGHS